MSFAPVPLPLRSRVLVGCWVALLAAGCSRPALTTEQGAALAAAEERWRRGAVRDYSFEYHPLTFPAFGEDAARIEVRGGVVTAVTRLGRHQPSPTTIDELFGGIRRASEGGRYSRIESTYDPRLGYPTRIVFTARQGIADGNAIVEVRAFEILGGPMAGGR
jgi:Family of unknown function (DUF6174)